MHALWSSSCSITTLDLPQSAGMSRLSTVCSSFETLTPLPIYPTARTCAQRLSSQGKKKSALLGNEVPSLEKSSALLLIKQKNHPSIPLRPWYQTGLYSLESQVFVAPSTHKSIRHLSKSMNTLQVNASSRLSSPPIGNFTIAKGD